MRHRRVPARRRHERRSWWRPRRVLGLLGGGRRLLGRRDRDSRGLGRLRLLSLGAIGQLPRRRRRRRWRQRRPFSGRVLPQPSLREEGARAQPMPGPRTADVAPRPPDQPVCCCTCAPAPHPLLFVEITLHWLWSPGWGGALAVTPSIGRSSCLFRQGKEADPIQLRIGGVLLSLGKKRRLGHRGAGFVGSI